MLALRTYKRFIPFPTFSLELDRACASVSREAILSRQRLVKTFAFGTCIFTHVSLWLTWRARPSRDGQKGNKKHLSCNIAAKRVESDVARFTTHIKPVLQQIRSLTGLTDVGRETGNIVF